MQAFKLVHAALSSRWSWTELNPGTLAWVMRLRYTGDTSPFNKPAVQSRPIVRRRQQVTADTE